jgi:hypothetical protein
MLYSYRTYIFCEVTYAMHRLSHEPQERDNLCL